MSNTQILPTAQDHPEPPEPPAPPPPKIDWLETQIEIGETEFFFRKIPGMRAWDYFGSWRQKGLSKILGHRLPDAAPSLQPEVDFMISLIRGIAVIDQKLVDEIRRTMFGYVDYYKPGLTKNRQPLQGMENEAFADLGIAAVIEVFGRALAVNFTDLLAFLGKTGLIAALSGPVENTLKSTTQP